MKKLFTLLLLCVTLTVIAKPIKLKYKTEVMPFTVTLTHIVPFGENYAVFGKIKQKAPFSHMVDFSDIEIRSQGDALTYKGFIQKWNNRMKFEDYIFPIGDEIEEEFCIQVPKESIPFGEKFDMKLGNLYNSQRTDLVIKDIFIKAPK